MKFEMVTLWVCTCCMLSHANGECCADDEHGGDSMIPLSSISPEDDLSMGMATEDHVPECTAEDRENGCDCEHHTFSTVWCDGCDSHLAGDRYAMTLFVGGRRLQTA